MPEDRTSGPKLPLLGKYVLRIDALSIYDIQNIATEGCSENFEEGARLNFICPLSTSAIDSQTPPEKRKPLHKAEHDKA
jgi:hypothetical protein